MTAGPASATSTGWHRIGIALASVGGLGYVPIAPGTVGAAAGLLLYWLLPMDAAVQVAVLAIVLVAGVWSSGISASVSGNADPSQIVIDEVAGQLVACLLLPKTFPHLAIAFMMFRVFDIGKWFPMKQLERLPGGWGIMADDIAAGALARLCLLLLHGRF